MPMKRIRMELARDHDYPEGSRQRGYEFAAPLDEQGHLLADEWRVTREKCRVKRFWPGQKDEIGHLVHRRGGSWAFATIRNAATTTSPASSSTAIAWSRASTYRSPSMTGQ